MCNAEATQRSCGVYIRQAVWVRGQNGLRRLGDEGPRGELLSNSVRWPSLCNNKIHPSDKSHLGTYILTTNDFSA